MSVQKTTTTARIDDTDGTPATTTVHFTVNGVRYTLDLNDKNAAAFNADMAKWVKFAGARKGSTSTGPKEDHLPAEYKGKKIVRREVITWAKGKNFKTAGAHYIAKPIVDAYLAMLDKEITAAERRAAKTTTPKTTTEKTPTAAAKKTTAKRTGTATPTTAPKTTRTRKAAAPAQAPAEQSGLELLGELLTLTPAE